jgi:hypothetical protein
MSYLYIYTLVAPGREVPITMDDDDVSFFTGILTGFAIGVLVGAALVARLHGPAPVQPTVVLTGARA